MEFKYTHKVNAKNHTRIQKRGGSTVEADNTRKTASQIEQERTQRVMEVVAQRASFYRANPNRFARDYLNLHLKLFQQILLVYFFTNTHIIFLASRGLGKTFMLAIFCVCKAILYPGSKIVVASKTRKQANQIIGKILTILVPNAPLLKQEIDWENTSDSLNNSKITFLNGSQILVVTANENARSERCHVLCVDEYRLVDEQTVVNTVLRRFMTAPRHPGYLDNPAYKHLAERNQELYASSCWYEEHEAFEKAKGYVASMVQRRPFFICGLPYQLAIKEDLLSREQVEEEKAEANFSETTWLMEMDCLWLGNDTGSFYNFKDITKNRILPYAWLPMSKRSSLKDNKFAIPVKMAHEKRIMSVDIALMASTKKKDNDATSIFINSMKKTDRRYVSNIVYSENVEGIRTDDLALKIRLMFDEYDCDYLAIDCKGLGIGVVDLLLKEQVDKHTGKVYGALNVLNNDDLAARCTDRKAPKVIWAIQGSSNFNSDATITLREAFVQGSIRLLQNEYEFEDMTSDINNWSKTLIEDRAAIKMPYLSTTLLVNELVNLNYEIRGSVVRVHERSGMRKDRYSSLAYNIYVAKEIERMEEKNKSRNGTEAIRSMFGYKQPDIIRR